MRWVWPDRAILHILGINFLTKVTQICVDFLGYFEKSHLSQNFCSDLLGNALKIWATFYFHIWPRFKLLVSQGVNEGLVTDPSKLPTKLLKTAFTCKHSLFKITQNGAQPPWHAKPQVSLTAPNRDYFERVSLTVLDFLNNVKDRIQCWWNCSKCLTRLR